jgi:hypothetical protein
MPNVGCGYVHLTSLLLLSFEFGYEHSELVALAGPARTGCGASCMPALYMFMYAAQEHV